MPERPDLEHQVPILARELVGRRIEAVEVGIPVVLRVAVEGRVQELLPGHTVVGVRRQLHFVRMALAPPPGAATLELVVHPMLAGRFQLEPATARVTKDTGLCWTLDDGRSLRYRDREKMGKVYVVPADKAEAVVPGLVPVGLDVLDPAAFTLQAFTALAKQRRDQVRLFLMDKQALDSFGNCYADEALFAAGIHPKARVRELSAAQLSALHGAMVSVLTEARDEIARRDPPLPDKLRDFVKVRNRKGEPCPRCGDTVRAAGVRGHDAFFCPTCQPDDKGRGFVSWRR
ncbi:MAG: endonuclease VIII [Alphaproteobacteria bacterium]|nr:endonuclease VIII [Alphaproteobacteria bacterium]